jgi:REP element-mobilizing transposase RayT
MKNRKPNRMQGFDYSKTKSYFFTIVTKDRICHFGSIENNIMQLSNSGKIIEKQWNWILEQYPYVQSNSFVIMPNHVHGILEINAEYYGSKNEEGSLKKIKSLSQLLGAFKTTSSKQIHQQGNVDFFWQRSFHDRIIKNQRSSDIIKKYIENNPINEKKNDP